MTIMKSPISRWGRLALPYAEENPDDALDDKTEAVSLVGGPPATRSQTN